MGRAFHVLRPWDLWGDRANFEAQRAYDYVASHWKRGPTLVPPEGVELKPAEMGLLSEGLMEIWHA